MSKEQRVAREIVRSFWAGRVNAGDHEAAINLFRVNSAKQKELVKDYETIIKILEKALKEIKSNDDSESEE